MDNFRNIQEALISIFKVSLKDDSLANLVRTCHSELKQLIGEPKARNFYLALYVGDYKYILPYYFDEKDKDPINEAISLKGGLTDYIRRIAETRLIDHATHQLLVEAGELDPVGVGTYSHQWIGAPLCHNTEVHGVLVVQAYDETVFYCDDDVQILDYISRNISLAIERKNREQEILRYKNNLEKIVEEKSREILKKNAKLKRKISRVKKSERIQKILYNISEAKSKTWSLRELLAQIHAQIETLMDAPNFYVAIVEDREAGLFHFPYIVDENPSEVLPADDIIDIKDGLSHYIVKTERPLLVDQERFREMVANNDIIIQGKMAESWLGIPLKTDGGEVIGVVAVQSYTDPSAYTMTDRKVLSIISTTIADAVMYKQLEEENRALEEKLLESQKMEAIGILASGVAHEFNNLLSIIMGYAYNGKSQSTEGTRDHRRYSKIEKNCERAARLVDKLMLFTQKKGRARFVINDMAKIINDAITQLNQKAAQSQHRQPDITCEIKEDLWPVKIDLEEIEEVFNNILDNSIRAINGKEGGQIKIMAENFRGKPDNSPVKRAGKYIHIVIKDNGVGMTEETRQNIFHPFFTTREPGEGTGLGLAIVYAIVQEYYGSIEVESGVGEGTTFHIFLPSASFLH